MIVLAIACIALICSIASAWYVEHCRREAERRRLSLTSVRPHCYNQRHRPALAAPKNTPEAHRDSA